MIQARKKMGARLHRKNSLNMIKTLSVVAAVAGFLAAPVASHAKDMPYKRAITLKVGQSALVKGVRHRDCGAPARPFSHYKPQLPRTALGTFSDGGVGTTRSDKCGGVVPARGVIFTAKKPGKERLNVMGSRHHHGALRHYTSAPTARFKSLRTLT